MQPVVQVSARRLIHKAPSSANQRTRAGNDSSQRQAPRSSGHIVEDDDEDAGSEASEVEPNCKPQRKQKARRFHNEDLPGLPATAALFRNIIIPRWIFFYSSLDSPWKLAKSEYVTQVQKIWDQTLPDFPFTVALRDELIFALVCLFFCPRPVLMHFKVKQQTYNWQSELASHAHNAVEAFFHHYENFASAVDRADYVKWVVPEAKEIFGSHGDSIPVAPSVTTVTSHPSLVTSTHVHSQSRPHPNTP